VFVYTRQLKIKEITDMAEFKHCGTCPPFLKKECTKEGRCMMAGKAGKDKKGDKKPVQKGTYG
jgi:hypothetical protein